VVQPGSRPVERGHEVTVYWRSHHIKLKDKYYRGMHLVTLPTVQNKSCDTIVHCFLSGLHASFFDFEAVSAFYREGMGAGSWRPRALDD
jgi:hypothetical protein